MRNGSAAHKNQKRRRIWIALRAVITPSAAEGFPCTAVYSTKALAGNRCSGATYSCFHTGIVYRSARKISRFARNDDTGVRGLLVTSHKSLAIRHCFQIFGAAISRIVIPSAAEGFFLHCGQYHIGTGRETMPCCYVFLRSHRHRLSVCKKDFSLRSK